MAMHVGRVRQDQNFTVHFDGSTGAKANGSMVQKKGGGLGGRKALNDISNSRKPSAFQASKKPQVSAGGKSQVGGRKALSDLTNSGKPFEQQQGLKKKSQEKKAVAVFEAENLPSIAEEGFLHNHQECIKSQTAAMGLDQFLKTIGLDGDDSVQSVDACFSPPRKSMDESVMELFKMVELPVPVIEDRNQISERLLGGLSSPICGSPASPRLPWEDCDDVLDFVLPKSP